MSGGPPGAAPHLPSTSTAHLWKSFLPERPVVVFPGATNEFPSRSGHELRLALFQQAEFLSRYRLNLCLTSEKTFRLSESPFTHEKII